MNGVAPSSARALLHARIVCPLAHERRALQRVAARLGADVDCCGPGASAVERWIEASEDVESGSIVILAGVAGGLDPELPGGSAWCISSVIDESGRRITPRLAEGRSGNEPLATITSSPLVLTRPEDKQDLAERSGAQLVDLESVAFARLASCRAWRWGIVRGISDAANDALPERIGMWVDESGRVRPMPILADVLRRPRVIRDLLRIGAASRAALQATATCLTQLLTAEADWTD